MGKQIISFLVITSACVLDSAKPSRPTLICPTKADQTALTAGSWKKLLKEVSWKSACRG